MKLSDLFESHGYSKLQAFVITAWGNLLYMDYEHLPTGADYSSDSRLLKFIDDYDRASQSEKEEHDEWIAEGMPYKGGAKVLNRTTINMVLMSAERPLSHNLMLYRHTDDKRHDLRPHSWLSLTSVKNAEGYKLHGKNVHEYHLPKGTLVVDTDGLADRGEYIVSTDALKKLK